LVYEIIPASSARFPCLNIQSRDRSPPRFIVLSHVEPGEKETYFLLLYVVVGTACRRSIASKIEVSKRR